MIIYLKFKIKAASFYKYFSDAILKIIDRSRLGIIYIIGS